MIKQLFSREKKTDKKEKVLELLERLEKKTPEKKEIFQDIRIDIMENIQLSDEKKKFLTNEIKNLKNAKKTSAKPISEEPKLNFDEKKYEKNYSLSKNSLTVSDDILKEIKINSDLLYKEAGKADNREKIEQIKMQNGFLQNKLREIISQLHVINSRVSEQISEAQSMQTKLSILENELDLKRSCIK